MLKELMLSYEQQRNTNVPCKIDAKIQTVGNAGGRNSHVNSFSTFLYNRYIFWKSVRHVCSGIKYKYDMKFDVAFCFTSGTVKLIYNVNQLNYFQKYL